jgi:two-component system sensor histidine kinase KdpD
VALILVVPVVAGVSVGGFGAGLVGVAACFLAYDYFFLPPYYTLYVEGAADWVALAVYAVVAVIVARVVAAASAARADSARRAAELQRLFDLSQLLVREVPAAELFAAIVSSVKAAFGFEAVTLFLPRDGRLEVAASAGPQLVGPEGQPPGQRGVMPVLAGPGGSGYQTVALVASGNAVGLLAVAGAHGTRREQEPLQAFANHLALALERAQLREEALRARLLSEVDSLRRALVGAVSHDLRTPLATIKLSASSLMESGPSLSPGDIKELAGLVDAQADRLDRLVANLLDMTRIQAGALELRRQPCAVAELFDEALAALGRPGPETEVRLVASPELPLVHVDPVLARQALANLLDNAFRHSPPGAVVSVEVSPAGPAKVQVCVSDEGPGVPEGEREGIFEMFSRREAGGRGGLGLAIAHAFLEAHGERIWLTSAPNGARFCFTLPVAAGLPAQQAG